MGDTKNNTKMKVKHSVFFVIKNPLEKDQFLLVKRPKDDEDLPEVWGLPAGSVKATETFEEAAIRQAKNKLNVEVKIKGFIGRGTMERKDYTLHGEEFLCSLVQGNPEINKEVEGTIYEEWKWGSLGDLFEAAEKGSLCSNILLKNILGSSPVQYNE